ncbi:hypothetical protein H0V99_02005 [Candidatus Saccharibacteria bacterium]|nr:hypothetical protein [Candidatus Saccharibacteria bacterium]
MEDKDKTTEVPAGTTEDDAGLTPSVNQKSDKTPEELMAQVNQESESLEPSQKKSSVDAMADESTGEASAPKAVSRPRATGAKRFVGAFNVYLLLFLLLIIASGAVFVVTYYMNKKESEVKLATSELTEEDLEILKTSDAIVGDPKQILTIESNAVITGKVVLRDTLDIAGALRVGGVLSVPSISISGSGSFSSLTTNDIQAAGNMAVGGFLDVVGRTTLGENLTVAGDINGGGKLDIGGAATINGNLNVKGIVSAEGINFDQITLNRINISGTTPSIIVGGAAGGGATASISGSDTAGTATINTGGGTGTGTLATITFSTAYTTSNPHAVLTPNGTGCSAIAYYVTNISATAFSIASSTAPPAGTLCRFNYLVIN